ncbi:acyl-CoA thioesterase [Nonomuraea sp. LPB2021202275-12-8]|uniref:acyl-CoA thioesterase n=1 Tax=Nonomuraea sp. LPB2021202275-12-8 TaxID=3120159 RepID=UPI00300CF57A
MTDASSLLAMLDLEQLDSDLFVAPAGGLGWERTFGGQVVAQALRAACLTVDGPRDVHSLHSYFIRPARPGEALRLHVARTRDGRTFSTRSVTAVQEGKPIFEMIASFHEPEPGESWQAAGVPSVPQPEELPSLQFPWWSEGDRQFEIRPVAAAEGFPISHPFWIRLTAPVGGDPDLNACLLTYLSDIAVVQAARSPHTQARHTLLVSLDHAIWFHRRPRVDEWLLYDMNSVAHIGTRGLAQGSIRTADGTLIASVAQEALLRS